MRTYPIVRILAGILLLAFLAGCSGPLAIGALQPSATPTPLPTNTVTVTPSPSATATETATLEPSPTSTFTATVPPTETLTPTVTLSPTPEASPTYAFPEITINEQANCRYGPGTAYLYSHGLYAGDHAIIHGRNYTGTWLWIKPDNLNRHCWAAASVGEVTGDVKALQVVQRELPTSVLYGPPGNVQASRNGNEVTVTWDAVWMTEDDDRGYLIEASVCQNGTRLLIAVHTDIPGYTFTDEPGCAGSSGGQLFTVEKHGYTASVPIPWP